MKVKVPSKEDKLGVICFQRLHVFSLEHSDLSREPTSLLKSIYSATKYVLKRE